MADQIRCACRGNNRDCFSCFGTGFIEEGNSIPEFAASRKATAPKRKPGKQRAPVVIDGRLPTAIRRILGEGQKREIEKLTGALALLEKWVAEEKIENSKVNEVNVLLAKAAKCDRQPAKLFFSLLALEVGRGGQQLSQIIYDLNGYLRAGQSTARVTEQVLKPLMAAGDARRDRRDDDQRSIHQPSMVLEKRVKPKPEPRPKKATVENLIVIAKMEIDEGRLQDCARFIDRHALRLIYINGSKKMLRAMKERFNNVETVSVENEANLNMIRSRETTAVFDLGRRSSPAG